ncbi:MAG: regulatory protein RecX [Legionellaceae bacterium]|nr:regulatory protein RecX [Legionellaceae bacterium]
MNKTYAAVVRLLARREYAVQELRTKLLQKGHEPTEIEAALTRCIQAGYQSDQRYAEQLCRARFMQGYGPLRVVQELHYQGVSPEVVQTVLASDTWDWVSQARIVCERKSKKDSFLQRRLLWQRGFPAQMIDAALKSEETI